MRPEEVLRVIGDHLPAVENVPRSVSNEGHEVLGVHQVNATDSAITIRRGKEGEWALHLSGWS